MVSVAREVQVQCDLLPFPFLAAKAWGDGATKILALHGWLDNSGTWDQLAPHLAENGAELVCLDLAGHGRSRHKPLGGYDRIEYVGEILSCATALWGEDTPYVLLGHSMGAALAFQCAAVDPRVSHLISIDAFGPWCCRPEDTLQALQKSVSTRIALAKKKPRFYPSIDDAIAKIRANNPTLAKETAEALARRGTATAEELRGMAHHRFSSMASDAKDDKEVLFLHDIRLRVPKAMRFTEAQLEPLLEALKEKPMIAIVGEKGLESAIENAHKRKALLGERTTVVSVPGGHHLHSDNAAAVLPHIVSFLWPK